MYLYIGIWLKPICKNNLFYIVRNQIYRVYTLKCNFKDKLVQIIIIMIYLMCIYSYLCIYDRKLYLFPIYKFTVKLIINKWTNYIYFSLMYTHITALTATTRNLYIYESQNIPIWYILSTTKSCMCMCLNQTIIMFTIRGKKKIRLYLTAKDYN